jgi:ABC-type nickel/cobalt efflux system permease component RcnA
MRAAPGTGLRLADFRGRSRGTTGTAAGVAAQSDAELDCFYPRFQRGVHHPGSDLNQRRPVARPLQTFTGTGCRRCDHSLYADKRLHSVKGGATVWGAFVIGFAFAFGWTPCVGPILAVILTFASQQDSVAKGIGLLTIYSLGLAVPFLLTSLGIERFLKFYSRFRAHMHALEIASGGLLIVLGVLLVFGRFTIISGYLSFLNRFAL